MTSTLCADDLRTEALPTPYGDVVAVLRDGGIVVLRPLDARRGRSAGRGARADVRRVQVAAVPDRDARPSSPGRPRRRWRRSTGAGTSRGWRRSTGARPGWRAPWSTSAGTAEVAFEVVDAHHGRGIGSLLLEAVTTVAAFHGVRRLSATVHPGNHASVRLLHHVGVRLRAVDGLLEGTSELRLPTPTRLDRGGGARGAGRVRRAPRRLDVGAAAG